MERKKIISLFSGAGGLDIGFEWAGFEIAVMVELDSACCGTLRKNRPDTPILNKDITKVTTQEILDAAGLRPLSPALVIGGPPCQSFSLAGKRGGLNDERGKLVIEFIRVVREALPVAFVMENVKGMVNWENGRALEAILEELKNPISYQGIKYNYDAKVQVLNAVDYGAPQFRERVFIVGNRIEKNYSFPVPTHRNLQSKTLFGEETKPYKSVWDAIANLPEAQEPSETARRVAKTIKKRIETHGY
ncbi:MAG: DNA cytosine methyltransferase [Lewinellaceae bacterium]|nr:DNA cytosine methyltransferase [Saprospiraceae bacterium]MCB9338053.1 DNA cytosine methyltransferase [Lewinellaceae bacterium]